MARGGGGGSGYGDRRYLLNCHSKLYRNCQVNPNQSLVTNISQSVADAEEEFSLTRSVAGVAAAMVIGDMVVEEATAVVVEGMVVVAADMTVLAITWSVRVADCIDRFCAACWQS